jgi:hypothetical protein
MSIATLIIGNSGTGKSTSLRNLDPANVLLIQTIKKPLPFKSVGWKPYNKETKEGSVYISRDPRAMVTGITKAKEMGKSIVIIDDWQYQMAGQFMDRSAEKGYDKFTDLAKGMWDVAQAALSGDDSLRVYFLTHSQQDEYGSNVKMKTLGKLLDEKVTIEGLFTIVLRSHVQDGRYFFTTQNDGTDTVKSPIGLFESFEIDNDLKEIDGLICNYYGIGGKSED